MNELQSVCIQVHLYAPRVFDEMCCETLELKKYFHRLRSSSVGAPTMRRVSNSRPPRSQFGGYLLICTAQ